jgi:hypothetical protein
MHEAMDDQEAENLGVAIRHAIEAAMREGAEDIARELRAILMTVPVEHGGEHRR